MTYDFYALLSDYGIDYKNEVDGWLNIECPICHHSGTRGYKGGLNLTGGYYNCWNCGGHSVIDVFMELLGKTFQETKTLLEKYSTETEFRNLIRKKKPSAKHIELPGTDLAGMHKKYLISRGFDPLELVSKYKIKGTGLVGNWKLRIIIPIIYKNQIVSFQGRDITDKAKLRYLTLAVEESIVDPKKILYNLDNCNSDTLGVVEGVFDVWRLGDGFACTLGTSMGHAQIKCIQRNKYKRVIFIFDPEKQAQERAIKQARLVASYGIKTEVVDMQWKHDPGSLTKKEIEILRKELRI